MKSIYHHTLAALLFAMMFTSACTENVVREESTEPTGKLKTPSPEATDRHIELFGVTQRLSSDSATVLFADVDIEVTNMDGVTERFTSNDTGYYFMQLAFDETYLISYSRDGYYTKTIELDTRFVNAEERKLGYEMPTDMLMERAISEKVRDFYAAEPIGKAMADTETGILNWDIEYTRRQKERLADLRNLPI